tara:strand:- start:354 stop:968 length:615 start_codon:yes stop_codon:yes gene_type:complete
MSNTLDQIIKALPGDLSKSGAAEIHNLINEHVEQRVAKEVNLLESKVSGFLRTKLEEMKETAQAELRATDETYRAVRIYEAVKQLVAADIVSEDKDSIANSYAAKIAQLEEAVTNLNGTLELAAQENHLLESKLDSISIEKGSLMEENLNLQERVERPFRSSESAVVITNETDSMEKFTTNAASDNHFLTEDVVRLSRTFTEDN